MGFDRDERGCGGLHIQHEEERERRCKEENGGRTEEAVDPC